MQSKHSVTIEDDGQPLIHYEEVLSEELMPILVVCIRQLGNPVPPFTGKAGRVKTKTHDGKKVTIAEESYYGEIPARVSEESKSDEEDFEEESSEPRPSDEEMFDIGTEAQANTKINAETLLPHRLGQAPAQPAADDAPQTHQDDHESES